MAARKLGNTVSLPTCTVTPEVAAALTHLSHISGCSKAYLIRTAVENYVSAVGVVLSIDNPTAPAGPNAKKG